MTRQQLLTSLEAIAITLRDWIGTGNAPPQAAFAEQHVRAALRFFKEMSP